MADLKKRVYDFFDMLGIEYTVVEHSAIFSEKDSENIDVNFDGLVCKNLFLKDKKETKFYLVSLPLHKRANIQKIEEELDIKKLSFGTADELYENLKIRPGSVSILNIIESKNTEVTYIIDEELKKYDKVCFHPNDNTASISFEANSLNKILDYFDAKYLFLKM